MQQIFEKFRTLFKFWKRRSKRILTLRYQTKIWLHTDTYLLSTFSQIYWEECYQTELANFEDHGDVGEVWFGEDSALRMVKWLVGHPDLVAPGSSILDSGTGTLKKVGIPFCIVLYADILPLSCLPSSFASLDCFLCYLIFLNLFPIFGHNWS